MATQFNATTATLQRYDHCSSVIIDTIKCNKGELPHSDTDEYNQIVKAVQHILAGNAGDLSTYLRNTTNPTDDGYRIQMIKQAAHQWRLLHRLAEATRVLGEHNYECLLPEFHQLYHHTSTKLYEYTMEPVDVLSVLGLPNLDEAVQSLGIVALSPKVDDKAHADYLKQQHEQLNLFEELV